MTGVRPDGYHELEAEMVTLDLADELQIDDGRVRAGRRGRAGGPGRRPARPRTEPGGAGPGGRAAGTAGVRLTKRIPLGGGLGGGSADAAAVLRWAGCADPEVAVRLGADVPFCLVGGRARVEGVGEQVTPLPVRGPRVPAAPPALRRATRPGLPGLGRADPRARGRRMRSTAAALAVEPRLAAWRDALGELTGQRAGAGRERLDVVRRGRSTPSRGQADGTAEVRVGAETARLVRARTVPAGWEGD